MSTLTMIKDMWLYKQSSLAPLNNMQYYAQQWIWQYEQMQKLMDIQYRLRMDTELNKSIHGLINELVGPYI